MYVCMGVGMYKCVGVLKHVGMVHRMDGILLPPQLQSGRLDPTLCCNLAQMGSRV